MDDRGRLARPLTWIAQWARSGGDAAGGDRQDETARFRLGRILQRWSLQLSTRLPRGAGLMATAAVILASIAYGTVKGGHVPTVITALKDARDAAANAAGFRIVSIALAGNHHVSREEVLAIAGVTGTSSLLFLDVEQARERLKTNPWIADASVLKLYPGELQIAIKERLAFVRERQADLGDVLPPSLAGGTLGALITRYENEIWPLRRGGRGGHGCECRCGWP